MQASNQLIQCFFIGIAAELRIMASDFLNFNKEFVNSGSTSKHKLSQLGPETSIDSMLRTTG